DDYSEEEGASSCDGAGKLKVGHQHCHTTPLPSVWFLLQFAYAAVVIAGTYRNHPGNPCEERGGHGKRLLSGDPASFSYYLPNPPNLNLV
ncbi:MAG: hypothetical protein NTX04_10760, partial [Verrucomicrobia bacterium]|nr:hypothetical protein [Verrucomicrobiota bacterium]